jgi:hypothetical protein
MEKLLAVHEAELAAMCAAEAEAEAMHARWDSDPPSGASSPTSCVSPASSFLQVRCA